MNERYALFQDIDTDEYHIFEVSKVLDGKYVYNKKSICKRTDYYNVEKSSDALDEDDMCLYCASQDTNVRHMICADCVKTFYKTEQV